jgi:hypothetical protein
MLAAMAGLVYAGSPIEWSPEDVEAAFGKPFCLDPPGRDTLLTPDEILQARCAECKKFSILGARWLLDTGQVQDLLELCMTVEPEIDQEHVFVRSDGQFRDFAVEAGMPVRSIGDFIAYPVWRATS